jgi:hypothetical protein
MLSEMIKRMQAILDERGDMPVLADVDSVFLEPDPELYIRSVEERPGALLVDAGPLDDGFGVMSVIIR